MSGPRACRLVRRAASGCLAPVGRSSTWRLSPILYSERAGFAAGLHCLTPIGCRSLPVLRASRLPLSRAPTSVPALSIFLSASAARPECRVSLKSDGTHGVQKDGSFRSACHCFFANVEGSPMEDETERARSLSSHACRKGFAPNAVKPTYCHSLQAPFLLPDG